MFKEILMLGDIEIEKKKKFITMRILFFQKIHILKRY